MPRGHVPAAVGHRQHTGHDADDRWRPRLSTPSGWRQPNEPASTSASNAAAMHPARDGDAQGNGHQHHAGLGHAERQRGPVVEHRHHAEHRDQCGAPHGPREPPRTGDERRREHWQVKHQRRALRTARCPRSTAASSLQAERPGGGGGHTDDGGPPVAAGERGRPGQVQHEGHEQGDDGCRRPGCADDRHEPPQTSVASASTRPMPTSITAYAGANAKRHGADEHQLGEDAD